MSIAESDMSGVKGKKTPGKLGRSVPSEPFHMSTRRAAKNPNGNGTPSANGSLDDDASHRSSFDELRPVTSYSNSSQVSPQRLQFLEHPMTVTSPEYEMNGITVPTEAIITNDVVEPMSEVQQTRSPSRKRKRSSLSPPEQPDSFEDVNDEDPSYGDEYDEEGDDVMVIDPALLSDHGDSQNSYQSEEEPPGLEDAAGPSIDATPQISGPVSPTTSDSVVEDVDTLVKPLNAALEEVVRTAAQAEADAGEEIEDGDDVDEAEDADDGGRWDDDEGRPRRRFGGRRRAAHPIPEVEVQMRRQAQIKSAYRVLARAQKQVLIALADRTIEELEKNEDLYLQVPEYTQVKEGLDAALAHRKRQIETQLELNKEQLLRTYESHKYSLFDQHRQNAERIRDDKLSDLDHSILRVDRSVQMQANDTGYETEDEYDVVPVQKAVSYRGKILGSLDERCASRSQRELDTATLIDDMDERLTLQDNIVEAVRESEVRPTHSKPFTVMNPTPREFSIARHHLKQNADILAAAAAEVERLASIPIIKNEDAQGLQLLGDLATRPSITSSARESMEAKRSRDSYARESHSRRPHPPPLRTNMQSTPIQLAVSPRTAQLLGERFAKNMPPPLTPIQGNTPFIRSPEAARQDQPVPSPMTSDARLQPFTMPVSEKPHASRRQSHHEPFRAAPPAPQEPRLDVFNAPYQPDFRSGTHPLWREYPAQEPPAGSEPRGNPIDSGIWKVNVPGAWYIREVHFPDSDEHSRPVEHGGVKEETPPPYTPAVISPWHDKPNPAGYNESRYYDRGPSWPEYPRHTSADRPRSPHSRHSSNSFPTREHKHDGGQSGDRAGRPKQKEPKPASAKKPSKTERGGSARRDLSQHQRKLSKDGVDLPPVSPRAIPAVHPGSPPERSAASPAWHEHPSQHSPRYGAPPQLPAPFPGAQYGGPPPQMGFHQQSPLGSEHRFYHHHRMSSGTNLPPPPPQHQPPSWQHLPNPPPSDLYAVPHHPPPPGVPPEQYNRFAPVPPPPYPHPPQSSGDDGRRNGSVPPHASQSIGVAAMDGPDSYTPPQPPPPHLHQPHHPPPHHHHQQQQQQQQPQPLSGPPLAPAPSHPHPAFHHPGYPAAGPPPVFAQRRHNSSSLRRRTHSDVPTVAKFHPWSPPAEGAKKKQ